VLGEEQCVPADAATEVEHMLHAACLQHRHQRCHRRVRHKPIGAPLRRCSPLIPRLHRCRRHVDLGMMVDLADSDRNQAKPSAAG
jgi:hypothetical protein